MVTASIEAYYKVETSYPSRAMRFFLFPFVSFPFLYARVFPLPLPSPFDFRLPRARFHSTLSSSQPFFPQFFFFHFLPLTAFPPISLCSTFPDFFDLTSLRSCSSYSTSVLYFLLLFNYNLFLRKDCSTIDHLVYTKSLSVIFPDVISERTVFAHIRIFLQCTCTYIQKYRARP